MVSTSVLPGELHRCESCGGSEFVRVSESLERLAMECASCHVVYKWDWAARSLDLVHFGCGEVCVHGDYESCCPLCGGAGDG